VAQADPQARLRARRIQACEIVRKDSPACLRRLQGALPVQRATGDSSQVKDVISALKAELRE